MERSVEYAGKALMILVLLCGCQRAKQGAKDALNAGGEMAGTAATEVIEGVTTGVEQTWSVDVRLSEELAGRGLQLGKTTVETGPLGNNNRLIVYLTAAAAFQDTLRVIAVDKDSLEMGRAVLPIAAAAGSGAYYEIDLQDRTDLERKSRVLIR